MGFSQIKPKTKKIVRGERQEIAHPGLYLPHKVCNVPFWDAKKIHPRHFGFDKTNSSFDPRRHSNNPLYGV